MPPSPTPRPSPEQVAEQLIDLLVASVHPDMIGSSFRQEIREMAESVNWKNTIEVALRQQRQAVVEDCAEAVEEMADDIDWAQGVDENVQKFRREAGQALRATLRRSAGGTDA